MSSINVSCLQGAPVHSIVEFIQRDEWLLQSPVLLEPLQGIMESHSFLAGVPPSRTAKETSAAPSAEVSWPDTVPSGAEERTFLPQVRSFSSRANVGHTIQPWLHAQLHPVRLTQQARQWWSAGD